MRLVLDTNCVVSAFLWGGTPYKIIEAAVDGHCQLFTSGTLLAELEDVLSREKFATRFRSVQTNVAQLFADYVGQVTVCEEVTITHRGKPRAKIVSVQAARRLRRKSARELPLFGIWKGRATIKERPRSSANNAAAGFEAIEFGNFESRGAGVASLQ
jgi:putative PIN family toxin of toxin-antitoxin system